MGLKIVTKNREPVTLDPHAREILEQLLSGEEFLQHVRSRCRCGSVRFTGLVFQPVPYSPDTPKGVPPEFEQYYFSPDHLIVNVPPTFMFQARVFQPSRLCAVYSLKG